METRLMKSFPMMSLPVMSLMVPSNDIMIQGLMTLQAPTDPIYTTILVA